MRSRISLIGVVQISGSISFIDNKKEDELYNPITKDGSSVDPADDGERHIRPEDGDPIELEEE